MVMPLRLRVFGEVGASAGDERVEVGHARQRCVLAVLLVEVNLVVTTEQLLDRVWAERPPYRARQAVSNYVSRLRSLVTAEGITIRRRGGGYVLLTDPEAVDLHLFRALVRQSRETTNAQHALRLLQQAAALWRGEAFLGLDTPWLATVREGLALERFLPYRLNVLATLVSNALARVYAERFGLTIPQWRVLATLGQFGVRTARDVAIRTLFFAGGPRPPSGGREEHQPTAHLAHDEARSLADGGQQPDEILMMRRYAQWCCDFDFNVFIDEKANSFLSARASFGGDFVEEEEQDGKYGKSSRVSRLSFDWAERICSPLPSRATGYFGLWDFESQPTQTPRSHGLLACLSRIRRNMWNFTLNIG